MRPLVTCPGPWPLDDGVCVCVSATEVMVTMGYTRRDIEDSLTENKYDSVTATYLLLGRPSLDVTIPLFSISQVVFKLYTVGCTLGVTNCHQLSVIRVM